MEVLQNNCNIGMSDLPEMNGPKPEGCALELWAYISGKSLMPVASVNKRTKICETRQET